MVYRPESHQSGDLPLLLVRQKKLRLELIEDVVVEFLSKHEWSLLNMTRVKQNVER